MNAKELTVVETALICSMVVWVTALICTTVVDVEKISKVDTVLLKTEVNK